MINIIFEKVYKLNRIELLKNKRQDDFSEQTNDKIMAITTFGRDKPIIEVTKKLERKFPSINFQKVNKTALALKSILDKTKNILLRRVCPQTLFYFTDGMHSRFLNHGSLCVIRSDPGVGGKFRGHFF